jgi:HSP20 family protein
MVHLKVKPANGNVSIFDDFDRLFSEVLRPDFPTRMLRSAVESRTRPAVNVSENKDDFRLEIAAPGLEKSDFNVHLEKDMLHIEVQKALQAAEGEVFKRREFGIYDFRRSFRLPETIDANGIIAEYKNGILSIVMPKREEAKVKPPRAIEIA